MAKDQMVQDFVQAVLDGEKQMLSDKGGALYDGAFAEGVASVPPATGGITPEQEQADIAAAVQAAVGPLNDQIAALQKDLADLQAAKSLEDAVVVGLQGKVQEIKDLADKLSAIVFPAPAAQP